MAGFTLKKFAEKKYARPYVVCIKQGAGVW